MISSSGNRKDSPNASTMNRVKLMYLSTVSSGTMLSPAKLSRNRSPFDSVSAANHPPSANSATADITNGRASRRSCFVSPGVTNRHSSYSSTGRAMAIPVATDTLNRIRNGSTTPVNTSLQPVGDLMTPSLQRFR